MSDSASSRQNKSATQGPRAPLFEARHKPLPPAPQPIQNTRDPFEDIPDVRPRPLRGTTFVAQPPMPSRPLIDNRALDAPPPSVRSPIAGTMADLHRVQLAGGYTRAERPVFPLPASRRSIFELFQDYPWLFAILAGVCIVIILLASAPTRTVISRYSQPGGAEIQAVIAGASTPDGEHSVLGQPTISADEINTVLAKFGSPAAGSGQTWIEMGQRYGINPAYALAFFIHESTAGTNSGWAGLKPDGSTTHNIGNIICAGYPTCFGRFRDYPSWDAGIEDWYKLIGDEYINGRGARTIEQIIPIYAPASDNNDVANYVQVVVNLVDGWKHAGVSQ
jgi:hypothetical protein